VEKAATEVSFKLGVPVGVATLEAWFGDNTGNERQGAYYVYVTKLD
jgi:hypothetical protein